MENFVGIGNEHSLLRVIYSDTFRSFQSLRTLPAKLWFSSKR